MKMENLKIKERNIVMGTQNGKITFIPQQGIVADNKKGVTAFFKFGEDVREQLVFPYTVKRMKVSIIHYICFLMKALGCGQGKD